MCFVGFPPEHNLGTVSFYKANQAPLYRYNNINNLTTNRIWKRCNWLGCCLHPYSEIKTLELLKGLADELGDDEDEDLDGIWSGLLQALA